MSSWPRPKAPAPVAIGTDVDVFLAYVGKHSPLRRTPGSDPAGSVSAGSLS